MLDEPTVLHLRARDRNQPYSELVVQSGRYLEQLRDPGSLARLRDEIALAGQSQAAHTEQHATNLERRADEYERWARTLETEAAGLRQRSQQLADLQQGGWWKLRSRLLPLLELYWRLRGRPGGRRPSS